MLPTNYIQEEYDKLTEAQKVKFNQLVSWTLANNLPGVFIQMSFSTYENILKMVQNMGPEPICPVEPDMVTNPDWDIISKRDNK
jgi:hypothetical protein